MTPFLKRSIDIEIQSQVSIMQICYICIYYNACTKSPHRHAVRKTQQTEHCQHPKKPVNSFSFHQPVCYVSTSENIAYLGSFAEVAIPVYLQYLSYTYQKIRVVYCQKSNNAIRELNSNSVCILSLLRLLQPTNLP